VSFAKITLLLESKNVNAKMTVHAASAAREKIERVHDW
jgi:hypothetical protein